MKKEQSITVGEYIEQLNGEVQKLNRRATRKRIWRTISLLLVVGICIGSIIRGINTKTLYLEEDYQNYIREPNSNMLYSALLEYKDVLQIFERTSLGNSVPQTQMGGFFYNRENISIYPDIKNGYTAIDVGGQTEPISESFASNSER